MGKVFITDEVNDSYTADVTNGGKLKVETGASTFHKCTSAQVTALCEKVYDGACYLNKIIFGKAPATAASFSVYDCTTAFSSSVTAFGTSGSNIVCELVETKVALSGEQYPKVLPIDVYLASGLTVGVSVSAISGTTGCWDDITVVYQK